MEEGVTCCFCLGGDTDIPAFGNLEDAKDLISPCSQCRIVGHRKCLLEWFNALPSDKIKVIDVKSVQETNGGISANVGDSALTNEDMGVGQQRRAGSRIDININTADFTSWLFNIARTQEDLDTEDLRNNLIDEMSERSIIPSNTSYATNSPVPPKVSDNMVFLITDCPQCKHEIIFSLKRSALITLNNNLRQLLTRFVQYGGVFLGFTSAITGVVSMSYVALTTCGLKFMECLVPGPILVQFLTRNYNRHSSTYSSLSNILLTKNENYSIDNLEQALLKGLVDPLKFSRIPILPIVLYKMRSSSLISTIFGNSSDNSSETPIPINNWFTELMINGYISSLGGHTLVKSIAKNVWESATKPSTGINIFRGINPWKTDNMIAMLIPARWAYDLFFRLTLNKAYFDLTLKIRPRDIANSLSATEVDRLEDLNNTLGDLQARYYSTVIRIDKQLDEKEKERTKISNGKPKFKLPFIRLITSKFMLLKSLIKSSYFSLYFKTKLKSLFFKFVASIKHDYSQTYIYNSVTMRCITTMLWPFVSSKAGSVIYELAIKRLFPNIPQVKLIFLSNMIGMVAVVFIKDLFNMGISFHKGKQLSNLSVLSVDKIYETEEEDLQETYNLSGIELPGRFPLV